MSALGLAWLLLTVDRGVPAGCPYFSKWSAQDRAAHRYRCDCSLAPP